MAWRFNAGNGKDQAGDEAPGKEDRLSGKSLEVAHEIVQEMLEADHQALERYAVIPPAFPAKR